MPSRSTKFALPAIFLLLLGLGNIGVGLYKADQYSLVLSELQEKDPSPLLSVNPASRTAQLARQSSRNYQEQQKAQAKIDFYRLVSFGGKVFLGLSLFLFCVSFLLEKCRPTPSR